jgi:Uma2 family endonuclease
MTQAKQRFETFTAYLAASDDLEGRFLLIDGELCELPPESEQNGWLAIVLRDWLVQVVGRRLVRLGKCEIQVPVLHKGDAQNRFPDLVVLREDHLQLTQKRLTITLEMPPPTLVVEVVSPGKTNRDRDYIQKRAQYAAIGIQEYWVVDPTQQTILVLALAGSDYREVGQFRQGDRLRSPSFPTLGVTTKQIFQTAS